MRTNQLNSLKVNTVFIIQYSLSKISLLYFRVFSQKKITFVRKGGIGDAMMSTAALDLFRKKYPKTKISLLAKHPSIFSNNIYDRLVKNISFASFPIVWLMYEHYDFKFWHKKDTHIKDIIAQFIGIKENDALTYKINSNEATSESFINAYIRNKKYIVIQTHSGWWNKNRNWSDDKWVELVDLLKKDGWLIYQIGKNYNPLIKGVVDMRDKTSLSESFILIKYAQLFIGVNSFGEQVAGAYNVPSIILYGPTNPIYSLNDSQLAIFDNRIMTKDDLKEYDYMFCSTDLISADYVYQQVNRVIANQKVI